jgi:hypothetical protein
MASQVTGMIAGIEAQRYAGQGDQQDIAWSTPGCVSLTQGIWCCCGCTAPANIPSGRGYMVVSTAE